MAASSYMKPCHSKHVTVCSHGQGSFGEVKLIRRRCIIDIASRFKISMMHCVVLIVLVCWCLMETRVALPIINTRHPKDLKSPKKYKMKGNKIIMNEREECRVYCIKKYFSCFQNNGCHLKHNEHRLEKCKEEYKDCMKYSNEMMRRIEDGAFPPTSDFLDLK
ncbi:hypothetical protein LSAT2_019003 [Lamellibrachia satsuma]|nr:hypothetical protein LSAT2_019003 [Lamellibrachia satsuma]